MTNTKFPPRMQIRYEDGKVSCAPSEDNPTDLLKKEGRLFEFWEDYISEPEHLALIAEAKAEAYDSICNDMSILEGAAVHLTNGELFRHYKFVATRLKDKAAELRGKR